MLPPNSPRNPVNNDGKQFINLQEKTKQFKTVGTCRLSKNGEALSIKLFPENRYLHIRKRDIEFILMDENKKTVANVREYEKGE